MEAAIKEGWSQLDRKDMNQINEWTKKKINIGLDYQGVSVVML